MSYLISAVAFTMLSIPSIGVREGVVQCPQASYWSLGTCINRNRVVKSYHYNLLLGHDYRAFPNDILGELKIGDRFRYGRKVYEVQSNVVVSPDASWVLRALDNNKNILAIQTCKDGISKRRIVFALPYER